MKARILFITAAGFLMTYSGLVVCACSTAMLREKMRTLASREVE